MPPMSTPPRADDSTDLGGPARAAGAVVWSAFLAAALATMLCFAFIDPQALAAGQVPTWWSSRLHVYALGFFFFWMTGLIAAGLCWLLAQKRNP
jgi:fructose-specific phosphotransferase system IIC component